MRFKWTEDFRHVKVIFATVPQIPFPSKILCLNLAIKHTNVLFSKKIVVCAFKWEWCFMASLHQ